MSCTLKAKADYYKSKLSECGKEHKAIFNVINKLLYRNAGEIFPNGTGLNVISFRKLMTSLLINFT